MNNHTNHINHKLACDKIQSAVLIKPPSVLKAADGVNSLFLPHGYIDTKD